MMKFFVAIAAIAFGLAGEAAPAMAADWAGLYAGVNAGYADGNGDAKTSTVFSSGGYFAASSVSAIATTGSQKLSNGGFTGGAQAGYSWQSDNLLYGVELDVGGMDLADTKKATATYPCCSPSTFTIRQSRKTNWLLTARPRLGVVSGDFLFYGTGGLAVTQIAYKGKFTDTYATALETANFDKTRLGWTVGAGVEAQVMDQWTIKGEYLYADFSSASKTSTNLTANTPPVAYPVNVFTHAISLNANIFRVGANYHF